MTIVHFGKAALVLGLAFTLSACEEGQEFNLFKKKPEGDATAAAVPKRSGKTIERDIEAPEVFQVTEAGLWDGRPSLGGVWVAHPDVKEPERVLIRNDANGKFVVGALFRRERENPGPRLQVSSDAADALGMLAGQPMKLNVTALRKEVIEETPPVEDAAPEELKPAETVQTQKLDPIAGAAAAIDKADGAKAAAGAPKPSAKPVAAAAPKPRPKASGLDKPYIQLGIFSVEQNAKNTATAMRQAGIVPTIRKQTLKGKTFWRVLVGPATSSAERATLLKKIKASGFTDAYAVTN